MTILKGGIVISIDCLYPCHTLEVNLEILVGVPEPPYFLASLLNNSFTEFKSAPLLSKCVANVCRNICGLFLLLQTLY